MILIIDNYDSFVYNLARYVKLAGMEICVVRNDQISVEECLAKKPNGVIISPGPKAPKDAGISLDLLNELSKQTPLLGVCLGHQCLVEYFGGVTKRSMRPLHGEASQIDHDGKDLFASLDAPLMAGRYHSLISILEGEAKKELSVQAFSEEGEIMAVKHKTYPWFGVQFHPESILTPQGRNMIDNFVAICRALI